MMKHNWEYKKLGDVCDYPNRRIAIKDLCVGEYVGVENLVKNRGGLIRSTVMPDADNSIEFHIGDVLIGNIRPYLRKIWLADFNGGASGDVVVVRVKKEFENKLQPSYLYKVLSSEKFFEYDNSNTKGAKMPRGDRKSIAKFLIPVPPLEEQSRIVAELDLLTGIIDKQNAQLKELDNLAQAIFYDMFGDPIENPKGWEVKKLESLGDLGRGVSKHRPRNAPELLGGTMPLIQTGDVANANYLIRAYNSTYSELGVAQSKVWPKGTLCITIAATIGKCAILDFEACFPDSVVGFTPNNSVDRTYIYFIFCNMQKMLEDYAPGVAQKNINLAILNSLLIPLPPLPLQQSFAEKIQSVEKQKNAIRASIADTQKLLDYTMDKYFG